MDPRFLAHNTHLEGTHLFEMLDPQLRRLQTQAYRYESDLLEQLPRDIPGIYTLSGGRQIGKTTLLKQWMAKLLGIGIEPQRIAFFSGELIDDHHALLYLLQQQLESIPTDMLNYFIIDEVTYIRDWDKTIKYLADIGLFDQVILILTGSDLIFIQEARMRFPGRQGKANVVNFHLYPLSFHEVVTLKHGSLQTPSTDLLFKEFEYYCIHGGYLTAINEFAAHQSISIATLRTYSDWIRGDMIKRGKQEHYLKEVIHAMFKRAGSQITWNALAKDLSIDHPKTIADYVTLLEWMDAVFIQSALLEDKLIAAPKKAKKLFFTDPFIFHAMKSWLYPTNTPFEQQIQPELNNPIHMAYLAELITVTHYRRFYPTYYIKAEGEVDIAYIHQQRFWPIEIKWTQQLREKDLKQILKYDNGLILTKNTTASHIQHISTEPLPRHLWSLRKNNECK
jgi:predicted AAA+ superfamily ATPase